MIEQILYAFADKYSGSTKIVEQKIEGGWLKKEGHPSFAYFYADDGRVYAALPKKSRDELDALVDEADELRDLDGES